MNWLLIVICAHLLNALVFVLTKYILDKHIKDANVLAILIGVLGMGVFFLAPWFLAWTNWFDFFINIFAGVLLLLALIVFNYALKKFEVTRIVPVAGGAVPFFTFVLAFVFLGERLTLYEVVAFVLLLVGTVIINFEYKKNKNIFSWASVGWSALAGLLFAASFVANKYAFDTQEFVSSFIWIRAGSFLVALTLLIQPKFWRKTISTIKKFDLKAYFVFFLTMVFGATGFLLLSYAINIGSVTLTNALQGIQYALLLISVLFLSKYFPKIIKEKYTRFVLAQKIIAIFLISAGIIFLAI